MNYEIKRNSFIIATCRPSGQQEKELMVKDLVPMTINSVDPIQFFHGDYVDVWGERYELNDWAEVGKGSTINYTYTLNFQAQYYNLAKWKLRNYDNDNHLTIKTFEIMATLEQFIDLVVANANRNDSGWTKGEFETTDDVKLLPFSGENILQAIGQIATAFDTEWRIINKTINLIRIGTVTGYKFEYGYDKGLKGGLRRTNVNVSGVFSRLFPIGSDKNLPQGYRSGQKNLQLPIGMNFIQGQKYGQFEIENDITFDDIMPQRLGNVTSVTDPFTFSDSGLDFNINDQLIPANPGETPVSAKVIFKTGMLAGYQFEIAKNGYNPNTKTIRIILNDLEQFSLPSDTLKPQVGDQYVLVDIIMPDSYVLDAENRLLERSVEYMADNASPQVAYEVPPDDFYFRENSVNLVLGNYYHVKDHDLLLDKDIRMIGYVRDLHEEFKYLSMQLSDVVVGSVIVRQYAEATKLRKALSLNKIMDINRSRTNWKTTNELGTLLDTLRAEMLLIMVDGGAYTTNIIATTTLTDFSTTAGQVFHEQYTENPMNGVWEVTSFIGSMSDNAPYYAYIKASRIANSAVMILSETKYSVEDDPSVYYFPFGIVSSIIDGDRFFTSIRGYTRVTGDTINTGRIVSNDGFNYFDLAQSTFNLGDSLSGLDWGVTADGQLTIRGRVIATNAEFVDLVVSNLKTHQTGRRLEITEADNRLAFFGEYSPSGSPTTYYEGLRIADNIDSQPFSGASLAGVRANNPAGNRTSYLSANGVFSNGGGTQFLSGTSGLSTNGSVVGLLFDRNTDVNGISSGVFGSDQTSTGNSQSYAGYFLGRLFSSTLTVSSKNNVSGQLDDSTIHTITADCTLPSNPYDGQLCIIQNNRGTASVVNGSIMEGSFTTTSINVLSNRSTIFIYLNAFGKWAHLQF